MIWWKGVIYHYKYKIIENKFYTIQIFLELIFIDKRKGGGATLQEKEKVINKDTFSSYILELKNENYVQVLWGYYGSDTLTRKCVFF